MTLSSNSFSTVILLPDLCVESVTVVVQVDREMVLSSRYWPRQYCTWHCPRQCLGTVLDSTVRVVVLS